jgi:two-component system response regulator HydG
MPDAAAPPATLLVADDDPAVRQSLERALTREGYAVVLAPDGQAALERLRAGGIDLVLSDLRMPGLTGLEFLVQGKAAIPDVDFILLTAFGTVEEAVKAMKDGAIDFITKPFQRAQLVKVVRQALERRALIAQNRALQQRLEDLLGQGHMIGVSPAFRRMMTLVEQVADSSATVLIQGESGTGKEGVAKSLHERSSRRAGPFVAVNCAALPETLLESELFGYEKGAFTGAAARKEGRFELADGGTLFLDEVADLSPVTQPKILRVLQEGEFERVGGTRTSRVDVRIVTATNQDLAALVREKRFREDLFYRLNVITIVVPPLRDRREDIPVLAQHYLRIYAGQEQPAPRRLLGGGARLPRGLCVARQCAGAHERGGARGGARPRCPRRDGGTAGQRRRPIGDDRPRRRGDGRRGCRTRGGLLQDQAGDAARRGGGARARGDAAHDQGQQDAGRANPRIDPTTVFRKLKAGEAEKSGGDERGPGKAGGG